MKSVLFSVIYVTDWRKLWKIIFWRHLLFFSVIFHSIDISSIDTSVKLVIWICFLSSKYSTKINERFFFLICWSCLQFLYFQLPKLSCNFGGKRNRLVLNTFPYSEFCTCIFIQCLWLLKVSFCQFYVTL